jgi:endoglucanase
MNLGDALDAPNEGEWGVTLDASDFARIHAAGFDHVRLPVRFSGHAASGPPYTIDAEFLRRVDWAIAQSLANDLAVIVDMHGYDEMSKDPKGQAARFVGLWRQIAARYRAAPQAVAFELLNEPHDRLNADEWNAIAADALRAVRETNPTRIVVLEGVDWASAKNLRDTLAIPEDPAIVGSFHMYQPILFTHQGAPWMPPEFRTVGVRFPGPPASPLAPAASAASVSWVADWFARYDAEPAATNPSGPAAVSEQLDMARAFADAHRIPVYMGEFAAIDKADLESRVTWTRLTRTEAEKRGIGWAYWDDGGSFAAYDRRAGKWIAGLLDALRSGAAKPAGSE